jgi:DNA-binding transcriptional regulator YhcF (GntR family)
VILRVDPSAPLPVIEQIRRQITRLVVSGQLEIGAQLPPIRQLAADLDLARGTVAKAYELLERDGVVETRGRHGTLIRSGGVPVARSDALEQAADQLAVVGHQLGVDLNDATSALTKAWDRLA